MFDPSEYTVTVKRVIVDDEQLFKATVLELPDVEAYGDSYQEAYELAIDAITTLQAAAAEEGRAFPRPQEAEEEYSGRVTLRMAKGLHKKIVQVAENEGISLNQYITSVLSYVSGLSTSVFVGAFPHPARISVSKAVRRQAAFKVALTIDTPETKETDFCTSYYGQIPSLEARGKQEDESKFLSTEDGSYLVSEDWIYFGSEGSNTLSSATVRRKQ